MVGAREQSPSHCFSGGRHLKDLVCDIHTCELCGFLELRVKAIDQVMFAVLQFHQIRCPKHLTSSIFCL